mmetsp:Transcript_41489/g.30495  ORF Transcript_41489/g.30495 Transcript_41489/m.30495 type:complete len:88 (+) Transcript_41489:367-630(+)
MSSFKPSRRHDSDDEEQKISSDGISLRQKKDSSEPSDEKKFTPKSRMSNFSAVRHEPASFSEVKPEFYVENELSKVRSMTRSTAKEL